MKSFIQIFLISLAILKITTLNSQDIVFSISVDNSSATNSVVSVYAQFDGSGNSNMIGYTFAFYYDALEATTAIGDFNFTPTTNLGWTTAGNNSYSNAANSNPMVPIEFTNRIEVQVFDGDDFVGSNFSTTPTLLFTISFNKDIGELEWGGEVYAGATADTDPAIVYNDNTGTGFPIQITGGRTEALPLVLLSFEATKSGEKNASLSWVTSNEVNTSHFSIERSYDKKSWTSIGSVAAAGYSIGVEHYSFEDVGVYDGVKSQLRAYYRLNMVDLDGRAVLSPVRNVDFGTGSSSKREVAVYPNPASEGIHVEWDINNLDQPTALEFYDINGKLIYTKEVAENSNKEYIDFSKTTLQPGLYMLRVLSGNTPIDHKQVIVGR